MKKEFSYAQFFVGLAAMLISVGVCYGIIQNKIASLEMIAIETKSDHDLLIRISANLESVKADVQEIKKDLKEHVSK